MHLKLFYTSCIAVKLTLSLPSFHSQVFGGTAQTHIGLLQLLTCRTKIHIYAMQQPAKTPLSFIGNLSSIPASIIIAFLLLNDLSGSVTSDFHCRALC